MDGKPPATDEMTLDDMQDEHRERCRNIRQHYRKAHHPRYRSKEENEHLIELMKALYGESK